MDSTAPKFNWTNASPASTTQDSYFSSTSTSKVSTANSTPATTPDLNSFEEANTFDTCKVGNNPRCALGRDFPKPANEIDVHTALERQPGRWTVAGQMAANHRRVKPETDEEELKAKRAREFEKAKRDLLAAHTSFQSTNTQR